MENAAGRGIFVMFWGERGRGIAAGRGISAGAGTQGFGRKTVFPSYMRRNSSRQRLCSVIYSAASTPT